MEQYTGLSQNELRQTHFQQLSAEFNKLLEENAVLKKENMDLRKLLLLPEKVVEAHETPIIISNELIISKIYKQ